jgi:catechol 2,3-dioxygenase-like lactoylglutathione lyase family enzyme
MKHITGLAHIALFTKDLETSIKFYECLGGKVTGQADVQKPLGTNHIKIVSMPGFDLEIIEPHDGTDVTAQGGLFPLFSPFFSIVCPCNGRKKAV